MNTMNTLLLDYICCPECRGELRLVVFELSTSNHLVCQSCQNKYMIWHGIPMLVSGLSDAEKLTAKNFGEQWAEFSKWENIRVFEEEEFLDYLLPLKAEVLKDKVVIEAGCGYGRNLEQARRYGAKIVIGFDVSKEALFVAKQKGIDVVMGDILKPPFKNKFDVVYTFGVLQHVSDPYQGINQLSKLVKDNGLFLHSVYSSENNFLLEKVLTPVREKVLRYMPPSLKWAFSWIIGIPSYIVFSIIYRPFLWTGPSDKWASANLFYYDFLRLHFTRLGLKIWIAFIQDHINAPLATYFKRSKIDEWIRQFNLKDSFVYFRNKNTWNFGGYMERTHSTNDEA